MNVLEQVPAAPQEVLVGKLPAVGVDLAEAIGVELAHEGGEVLVEVMAGMEGWEGETRGAWGDVAAAAATLLQARACHICTKLMTARLWVQ